MIIEQQDNEDGTEGLMPEIPESDIPRLTHTLLINCINDTDDINLIHNLLETDKLFCIDDIYRDIPGMEKFNDSGKILRLACDLTNPEQFKNTISIAAEPFDRCIIGGFGPYYENPDIVKYMAFFNSHVTVLDFLRAYGIKTFYRPLLLLDSALEGTAPYEWTNSVKMLLNAFKHDGMDLATIEEIAELEIALYK